MTYFLEYYSVIENFVTAEDEFHQFTYVNNGTQYSIYTPRRLSFCFNFYPIFGDSQKSLINLTGPYSALVFYSRSFVAIYAG